MNASAVAVQCFVGAPGERDSLEVLCRTADACSRYGMPLLGVTAVGKEMARTAQYFQLAARILAELGASVIKTYYCDDLKSRRGLSGAHRHRGRKKAAGSRGADHGVPRDRIRREGR